jgi:hypothetical protein
MRKDRSVCASFDGSEIVSNKLSQNYILSACYIHAGCLKRKGISNFGMSLCANY